MADRRSNYVIALKVDGSVKVTREFDKVGEKGEQNFKKIRNSAGRTNTAIAGMARNITSTLVPAFAAAASASSIFRNIQTFEKLDIRLRSLTSSAEDYANTQDYLKNKADELNVGIETLSDGYARLCVSALAGTLRESPFRPEKARFSLRPVPECPGGYIPCFNWEYLGILPAEASTFRVKPQRIRSLY